MQTNKPNLNTCAVYVLIGHFLSLSLSLLTEGLHNQIKIITGCLSGASIELVELCLDALFYVNLIFIVIYTQVKLLCHSLITHGELT